MNGCVCRAIKKIEKDAGGELTDSFGSTMKQVLETVFKFAEGSGKIGSEQCSTVHSLFRLLSTLGDTVGWILFNGKMKSLSPALKYVLTNNNTTTVARVVTLEFLYKLLKGCTGLTSSLSFLVPLLSKTVPQGWSVSRASLEACGELAGSLQGDDSQKLANLVVHKVRPGIRVRVRIWWCTRCVRALGLGLGSGGGQGASGH